MGSLNRESLARAIGSIPSGCYIMTAGDAASGTGLLASWVQQCSFDPPMLTVCIKEGRPIESRIKKSGGFVLNHISDAPKEMFGHFGTGFGPDEAAFEGLEVREVPQGVVIAACLGHLACKVLARHVSGDHNLYIAEIEGGELNVEGKPYVHLRKNGFSY